MRRCQHLDRLAIPTYAWGMDGTGQLENLQPPISHSGENSLQVAVGKVAVARMQSLGIPTSTRRHLEIAAILRAGQRGFTCEVGEWRLEAFAGISTDIGVVEVLRRVSDGRMLPQDPPDGAPARSYVARGIDPRSTTHPYHYLQRVSHHSMGKRWDPSPSLPAEVTWRENGAVAWTRRFVFGVPTDRGESSPALQSYWPSGRSQTVRWLIPPPESPAYSEFFPDGCPAVEVFGDSLVVSYRPDGTSFRREDFSSPRGRLDISRINSSIISLDFDPEKTTPGPAFLDQYPDGQWRVQRDMLPENPESALPWSSVGLPPSGSIALPRPKSPSRRII